MELELTDDQLHVLQNALSHYSDFCNSEAASKHEDEQAQTVMNILTKTGYDFNEIEGAVETHHDPLEEWNRLLHEKVNAEIKVYDVIAISYLVKEMIEPIANHYNKLYFSQANGYVASFYLCRKWLKTIQEKCDEIPHENLLTFYEHELDPTGTDHLRLLTKEQSDKEKEEFKNGIPF